jgi:glycosyltransferase involved in cell wall biosynthesis
LDAPLAVAGDDVSPDGGIAALKNVEFLGALDRASLAAEMARASVFASPARYEPFGLTILEAALSECALVLGDIPTLRELWDGAATFVSPDDAEGWREALRTLTSDTVDASEQGLRARGRAERYSAAVMGESYWEAYRALLRAQTQPITEAAA